MKREALVAPVLALGALALFYTLLFPKLQTQSAAATPLSIERGPDGLAGAAQWLRQAGVPVVSLRDRYSALERVSGPVQGNLLIVSLPERLPMRADEQAQLLHWVSRGNTLLILAAIDDTPAWATGGNVIGPATTLSHIEFKLESQGPGASSGSPRKAPASDAASVLNALLQPGPVWVQPRGRQALMSGVNRLRVTSALPAAARRGTPSDQVGALAIAERVMPAPRDAALWVEPYQDGQIILSAFASEFSNAQIDAADNARLLANIVAWSRGADGRVIFDDAHQGLVDFYDPQAFFADPRLHHTLEWILVIWFVWALGSQALRSGQLLWQPIAATTLMEASARFFSARVPSTSAAQQLLANFYDEIHRRRGEREDGSAPWEWLAAQPGLAPESLAQLRALHASVRARAPVNLTQLQNLLSQIRGSIQ
jgi:hypothetical protein